ncbi:kinase-like protein [Aspergillus sclerotiicarbonarius CBS 121057]|uniref:non-specific serine/threonine protein kinase n=1 Tax=Aspergillus sclerotiicarbonarius (strain CBS 121057 / IBT 28362) TaxID=1448318 RepID=A0A319EIR2_ASPSB|nr:kinase-like protein [Aspergillus sclerotiicarbonarius CBS 121057]
MPQLWALKHRPWPLSAAVAPKLPVNEAIEEERTPYYDPARFYPAHLGEVLKDRYQLATKLGYGSSSTIWLARDLDQWRWSREKYVALKINASAHHSRENAAQAELDILRHISEVNPRHKGWGFIRRPLDSFTIEHGLSKHLSLVFEPLREPLWIYRERFIGDVIPSDVLKILLQMILHGLDYLHSECQVIHTDLKPDNIMIKVEDPSILEASARDEHEHPLPQKECSDGRTIYLSRNNFGISQKTTGIIQITDFDLAVRGDMPNKGCIQAEIYRAPEVILDGGYSYSADIWSLGVMLWDLLEGKKLFKEVDPLQVQEYDEPTHLAYISALLGPPPKELLEKGTRTDLFYKSNGEFKNPSIITPSSTFTFKNTICNLHHDDKQMFIDFVQRMIKWLPEERSTAKELLQHPWLYAEFDED